MTPRMRLPFILLLAAASLATGAEPFRLSALERAQGWRLLFDGGAPTEWRGFRESTLPANWTVADGVLTGREGVALVSAEEFGDFELSFDWKVGDAGHGEVYFHVGEDGGHPLETGPRMDLSGHGPMLAGADGLANPAIGLSPQFDVWYQARITVYGNQVEYWLNGEKVTTYALQSADWKSAVAGSRYRNWPDFGRLPTGRIALAGSGVMFRRIKVKPL